MEQLKLNQVTKELVDAILFKIDECHINAGEIVGLIGRNGTGKSTLLKMIIGEDSTYQGQINVFGRIGYLPQIKATSQESGGEQVKRYLTTVLDTNPDFLILDEPTANLDQENIQWLLQKLKAIGKTILIVSHDRYFLNQLVDKIWFMENQTMTEYIGNYDSMQATREKERKRQEREYQHHQDTVKRLEEEARQRTVRANKLTKYKKSVSRSEWKARSVGGSYDGQARRLAKSAKSLEKRIDQLNQVEKPSSERSFKLESVGHLNTEVRTLINLDAGVVKQNDRKLFAYPPLKVTFGEKLAIQGPNQAGKTTFVRQLIHQILPGYYSDQLHIGYFAQDFTQFTLDQTVLENVSTTSEQDSFTIRNLLAMLGFVDQMIHKKVTVLSGGERVRVALAKVLLSDNNLLILDEPTNYLDVMTLEALEDFLQTYQGTVILISHDHEFMNKVVDTTLNIEEGQLKLPDYQATYSTNLEQEIQLLKHKRDQMIADPEVSIEDLREIGRQIKDAKDRL